MKAVILAAGMGTRLRPMTEKLPKGLIEIEGNTLLKKSLKHLNEKGIKETIIVTGYLGDQIKSKFGENFQGMKIQYVPNEDYATTGSMYSLSKAKELISNSDILLLESDLIYESKALSTLIQSNNKSSILVSALLNSGDDVYICTNDEGRLANLGKNISDENKKNAKGALVGISKLSNDFLQQLFQTAEEDYQKGEKEYHYEETIHATNIKGHPIHTDYCENLTWIEIDNENDLRKAKEEIYPKIFTNSNNKINEKKEEEKVKKEESESYTTFPKVKRNVLLNPGPATTTDTVKYAQIVPDICPREKEFGDVMRYINDNLIEIAGGNIEEEACVLFGGSGTAAMDATINSVVPPSKKILVINNGAYGERITKIAQAYNIGYVELKFEWDSLPDLIQIEQQLKDNPEISCVAMIHHETTTGLLNPIKEIGRLVKSYEKVFIVDTISSFAGVPIDIKEFNIDFMMSTSNKCIQGMAGVSFVICSKEQLKVIKEYPRRSFYLSLYDQYEYFTKNYQMRFTPPVQTLYALKKAIEEFLEEGYENRVKRYSNNWEILRKGIENIGLKVLTKSEEESKILITILYPKNQNFEFNKLHDKLFENGFTIYPGKVGKINSFRLSNMGAINEHDIKKFLFNLKNVLIEMGVKHD